MAQPSLVLAQGTVQLNNRIPGIVDARFTFVDGSGIGAGFTAELALVGFGQAPIPLTPKTTFHTSSAAAMGYVHAVDVTVPGVAAGQRATLVVRVFNGATFDSSSFRATTNPVTVTLGGGNLPPAALEGLQGFTFLSMPPGCIPPRIDSQPRSQTVREGATVTLSVGVSYSAFNFFGSRSERWYFNDKPIDGASSSTYTIQSVRASHAGAYWFTARDACGSATSQVAVLTVVPALSESDFDGDGLADILFQDSAGFLAAWFLRSAELKFASFLTPNRPRDALGRAVGAGHFDSDGNPDLLFQHADATLAVWFMDGIKLRSASLLNPDQPGDRDWRVAATGDFDVDGKTDLLFQHADGTMAVWFMNEIKLKSAALLTPSHPGDRDWRVVGTGDLDGLDVTHREDVVFQHRDGTLAVWFLVGTQVSTTLQRATLLNPLNPGDAQWRVMGVSDLNGDGRADLLFQHAGDGTLAVWFMDGEKLQEARLLNPSKPGGTWKVAGPR